MERLFLFDNARPGAPEVEAWLAQDRGELGRLARHWFGVLRRCGADVRDLLHDGHPTACRREAAFAYVDAYKAHVNLGFYHGNDLPDPTGLLEGSGKFMRHVKLRPDLEVDAPALTELIRQAYEDIGQRLA